MQTLTRQMAKGAERLFALGNPVTCTVHVPFNGSDEKCVLFGLSYEGDTARVSRTRDGRNGNAKFSIVELTDEDAARCMAEYERLMERANAAKAWIEANPGRKLFGNSSQRRNPITGQYLPAEAKR